MRTFETFVAILVMTSVTVVAEATTQTHAPPVGQSAEKIVQGQVSSIDPTGTEITLTDGTRLLTPPGTSLEPGALAQGMTVIASYREENGEKVLTDLAVEAPSASPPTDPRLPAGPPTAPPPRNPPARY